MKPLHGLTFKETLLGTGILLIALALIGGLGLRMQRNQAQDSEGLNMRRIFVALSTYSQANDDVPAPNLLASQAYLSDPSAFLVGADPYVNTKADRYPVDAGQPERDRRSPFRISYAYLWRYQTFVESHFKSWRRADENPSLGLLANEWTGKVTPEGNFGAQVAGPLVRLNVDGSLYVNPDRGGPKALGDAEDLFGPPHPR